MIGVQVTKSRIHDRGRDVALNCNREGALVLIEILQSFVDRNVKDHEHIMGSDGWEDRPFIADTTYFELANGLDINYEPSPSPNVEAEA